MDSQQKLQAVATDINQRFITETKRAITAIHNDIIVNNPVAILPESVFVEYFLDFFLKPNDYIESPLRYKWLELSGGPYNEVNIIDDQGIVLYTTPGLYCKPVINYDGLSGYNFSQIAGNFSMQSNITATVGLNYLNSALAGVSDEIKSDVGVYITRWRNIFSRYIKEQPTLTNINKPSTKVDAGIFDL